jgi:hypothetical protein
MVIAGGKYFEGEPLSFKTDSTTKASGANRLPDVAIIPQMKRAGLRRFKL